jgi:hypothetical protein
VRRPSPASQRPSASRLDSAGSSSSGLPLSNVGLAQLLGEDPQARYRNTTRRTRSPALAGAGLGCGSSSSRRSAGRRREAGTSVTGIALEQDLLGATLGRRFARSRWQTRRCLPPCWSAPASRWPKHRGRPVAVNFWAAGASHAVTRHPDWSASGARCAFSKARDETRTRDPFLTMEVLYQLSYPGGLAS